jgi:hypothetical protein
MITIITKTADKKKELELVMNDQQAKDVYKALKKHFEAEALIA